MKETRIISPLRHIQSVSWNKQSVLKATLKQVEAYVNEGKAEGEPTGEYLIDGAIQSDEYIVVPPELIDQENRDVLPFDIEIVVEEDGKKIASQTIHKAYLTPEQFILPWEAMVKANEYVLHQHLTYVANDVTEWETKE